MARYSRDQVREFKNGLALISLAVVAGLGVYAVGPGLQNVATNALEHRSEPWAAKRLVQVATVMSWTFRERRAVELYEHFYLYYSGNEDLVDFSEISEWGEHWYYIPSIAERYDDEEDGVRPRPKRIGDTPHPLLGEVLAAYAKHWEGLRRYDISDHIWRCLERLWPPGSPEQQAGAEGVRRSMLRSF